MPWVAAAPPGTCAALVQPDNDHAAALWSTEAGSRARLLLGMGPLETWSWRLEPGDTKRSVAHSSNSVEALIVTAGLLEVDIDGGGTSAVRVGRSMILTADVGHEYRNVADGVACFHLAVFDPIVGHVAR